MAFQDLLSKKSEVETLLSMHIVPGTLFSKGISWAEHQTLAEGKAPIATQVQWGSESGKEGLIVNPLMKSDNNLAKKSKKFIPIIKS